MIVYNVQRGWFPMKTDAETVRKAQGLPPSATATIRIETREELAALLNGLCGAAPTPADAARETGIPVAVIERNQVTNTPPDFVPKFLADDWARRMAGVYR